MSKSTKELRSTGEWLRCHLDQPWQVVTCPFLPEEKWRLASSSAISQGATVLLSYSSPSIIEDLGGALMVSFLGSFFEVLEPSS